MALAHRVTTPVAITVFQAATRDLQSPEKERVQVVTTPAAIIVWPRQTAAKQPFTDPVLAQVALIPAVTTAFRASDLNLTRWEDGDGLIAVNLETCKSAVAME